MNAMATMTAIFLAGGTGLRMNQKIPKQYLLIDGQPLFHYSLKTLLQVSAIEEIIIVCDPYYRNYFTNYQDYKLIKFALPGLRRQDSVYNGLQLANPLHSLICIHDAARPFIIKEQVLRVSEAAANYGAATLAMPLKFTIKEATANQFVKQTLARASLWEIQTPQILTQDILLAGFKIAHEKNITVTDDVSLAELIPSPVKLVEGSYENIKITSTEDLLLAKELIKKKNAC